MAPRRRFDIIYAPVVKEHLRFVERKHYPLIRKAIELQLWDAPDQESINRKRLAPTAEVEAEWELRCGPGNRFRVFYWIDSAELKVHVVGIGVKRGDRLRIRGEEVEL
jgi:hypothetical protein